MPSTIYDVLCNLAGTVAIVGPLLLVISYVKTVKLRIKEFNNPELIKK